MCFQRKFVELVESVSNYCVFVLIMEIAVRVAVCAVNGQYRTSSVSFSTCDCSASVNTKQTLCSQQDETRCRTADTKLNRRLRDCFMKPTRGFVMSARKYFMIPQLLYVFENCRTSIIVYRTPSASLRVYDSASNY